MSVTVRRCLTAGDFARVLEIYNAVWPLHAVTAEEVESWRRQANAWVQLLAAVDGFDAGSAVAAVDARRPRLCFTLITVLPEHRRRGAGDALLQHVLAWAAEHDLDDVDTEAEAADTASVEFAQRRAFSEISRDQLLELDVLHADASGRAPDGFEVTSLAERPELGEATWDVAAEAIPDIPGDEDWTPPPRERWAEDFLLTPATPPAAVFVAVADGAVVGYAKLRLNPDGRGAHHGMTAVRRAWRGRGIATALKRSQIAWAKSQGIERLWTANEVRNSAMQRVNERLGYTPRPGRVHLRASVRR